MTAHYAESSTLPPATLAHALWNRQGAQPLTDHERELCREHDRARAMNKRRVLLTRALREQGFNVRELLPVSAVLAVDAGTGVDGVLLVAV